jgi:dTDP-4-dehydrorhamnose reductase
MQNNTKPHVVILGANGMLGRAVYTFLNDKYPDTVWGTSRDASPKKTKIFYLQATTLEKDLEMILKKINHIDYIINCIAELKSEAQAENLIYINALFPHLLYKVCKRNKIKLLHISTDAVFSDSAGEVNEISSTSPEGLYGASKLLGEVLDEHALTIRTSIVGFDPIHQKGLFEWIKNSDETTLPGYSNQKWTGCTTLQLAQFCHMLIFANQFMKIRKHTELIHFAPLGPMTKYDLVKHFITASMLHKQIAKEKSTPITRYLTSIYSNDYLQQPFIHDVSKALKELLMFENIK